MAMRVSDLQVKQAEKRLQALVDVAGSSPQVQKAADLLNEFHAGKITADQFLSQAKQGLGVKFQGSGAVALNTRAQSFAVLDKNARTALALQQKLDVRDPVAVEAGRAAIVREIELAVS